MEIGIKYCHILDYLHSPDPPIIHRDITPENILREPSGEIKLVDFNAAHQLEGNMAQTVVGKHSYLQPKQFRVKPVPQATTRRLVVTPYWV